MTSDDADTAAGTPTDADGNGQGKSQEPHSEERTGSGGGIAHVGWEKSADLAARAKTQARNVTHQARVAATREPKRGWRAATAGIAAGAGIVAAWVIRQRRRQARSGWWTRLRRRR